MCSNIKPLTPTRTEHCSGVISSSVLRINAGGVQGTHGVPSIKPELTACKTSSLPVLLSLTKPLCHSFFLCFENRFKSRRGSEGNSPTEEVEDQVSYATTLASIHLCWAFGLFAYPGCCTKYSDEYTCAYTFHITIF